MIRWFVEGRSRITLTELASATPAASWAARSAMTTTSPALNSGTRRTLEHDRPPERPVGAHKGRVIAPALSQRW